MKSQRRHELEHNTLDAELAATWAFLKKHGNRLLTVVLVVLVVVVGWVYWNRRNEARRMDVRMRYDRLLLESRNPSADDEQILAGFRELASQEDVGWVAASALLEIGSRHSVQALLAGDAQARQEAIGQARDSFRQVLQRFEQTQPVAAGLARVGLGRLAEGEGDFSAAREHYQAVLDSPVLEGYPVMDQARDALAQLDRLDSSVQLATTRPAWADAKPVEPPAEDQPATAPARPAPTTQPTTSPVPPPPTTQPTPRTQPAAQEKIGVEEIIE